MASYGGQSRAYGDPDGHGGLDSRIPYVAIAGRFDWALGITALVLFECGILAVNGGRCPMTDVAARYTSDRPDNFDIFLPLWIARHNKAIFGTLFV